MEDELLEFDPERWWRDREEEARPARRSGRGRTRQGLLEDYYQCARCGEVLHVLTSTCPRCKTCYGC